MRPHLFKVSSTKWACSPSKEDKHLMRCGFGDTFDEAFNSFLARKVHDECYSNLNLLWNSQGTEVARGFQS